MHVEIKYAQDFVLNFLYNKLPRRRVNLFGEELESALRDKFKDHWYPDKPFKGSAFRCLKITDPADPVLNRAARESGNPILDIIENLPTDLAIWIDPGEVSYRIGEKGSVKILYSEKDGNPFFQGGGGNSAPGNSGTGSAGLFNNLINGSSEDLNPEIVGLLSTENLLSGLSSLSLSRGQGLKNTSSPPSPFGNSAPSTCNSSKNAAPNCTPSGGGTPANASPPQQQQQPPLTYTAGMFAQTKFGSTKLKTSGKKTSRMSPTEFSNYIKTRAALQKQQQQQHHHHHHHHNHQQHQAFNNPRMCRSSFRGQEDPAGGYFTAFNNSPSSSSSGSSYNSDPFKAMGSLGNHHIKGVSPPSPPTSSSSPSSSSWTYASDPETEAFLQDIFSVGLRSQVDMAFEGGRSQPGGGASFPLGSSYGLRGDISTSGRGGNSSSSSSSSSSSGRSTVGGGTNNNNNHFPSFKSNNNPGQSSEKYQQRILVAN